MKKSALSQGDQVLLTSALRELRRAHSPVLGSDDVVAVGTCIARYAGKCRRCRRAIQPGRHVLRFDNGYGGWVHVRCQQSQSGKANRPAVNRPSRPPQSALVCPRCHLDHRGECL